MERATSVFHPPSSKEQTRAFHVLAAESALEKLFAHKQRPLRELIQEYLESDESGYFGKLDGQRVVREWVYKKIQAGTSDKRILELENVLRDFIEKGGSLGPWAYDQAPEGKELQLGPTTRHDLTNYLEEVLPSRARPRTEQEQKVEKAAGAKTVAVFSRITKNAKTLADLQIGLERDSWLHSFSPEELAIEYALFLLSSKSVTPYELETWRVLRERASKYVHSADISEDRLSHERLAEDPLVTRNAKRSHLLFLVNAPKEGYLASDLFKQDVQDFLQKRTTQEHARQLPEVIDELEKSIRSKLDTAGNETRSARKIQEQLQALELVRTEALRAFGRPSVL